jgi:hypothetical protein
LSTSWSPAQSIDSRCCWASPPVGSNFPFGNTYVFTDWKSNSLSLGKTTCSSGNIVLNLSRNVETFCTSGKQFHSSRIVLRVWKKVLLWKICSCSTRLFLRATNSVEALRVKKARTLMMCWHRFQIPCGIHSRDSRLTHLQPTKPRYFKSTTEKLIPRSHVESFVKQFIVCITRSNLTPCWLLPSFRDISVA